MSRLTIYKTNLQLSQNPVLDNIVNYLASVPKMEFDKLQYKQVGTEIDVKVAVDDATDMSNNLRYNYAKLVQNDTNYYFYITDAQFTARKTLKLHLSLDTLNTYWSAGIVESLSPKTTIVREHEDRFKKISKDKLNIIVAPTIDRFNEGLNPVKDVCHYRYALKSNTESTPVSERWYVIYATRDDISVNDTSNPIIRYLVPQSSKKISNEQTGPETLNVTTQIPIGKTTYIIDEGYPTSLSVLRGSTSQQTGLGYVPGDHPDWTMRAIKIVRTGITLFKISVLYYTGESYPYSFHHEDVWFTSNGTDGTVKITLGGAALHIYTSDYDNLTSLPIIVAQSTQVNTLVGTIPAVYSTSFDAVDTSNSHFMKIVESPYVVGRLKQTNGLYSLYFGTKLCSFNHGYNMWTLPLTNTSLSSFLENWNIPELQKRTIVAPTYNEERNDSLETKIYSTEFYSSFFTFDNESYTIPMERIGAATATKDPICSIKYSLTSSMNSDKLFKFSYNTASADDINATPHENYLYSSRNTERAIQNSSYVDYLRSGYNYDQEAVKQQNKQATVNAIVNGVMGVTGASTQLGIQNVGNAANRSRIKLGTYEKVQGIYDDAERKVNAIDWDRDYDASGRAARIEHEADWVSDQAMKLARLDARTLAWKSGLSGAAIGVRLVASIGGNIYNAINAVEANNRNFAKSLSERQIAKASISGSAPTDLMDEQSGQLEHYTYTLRDEVKQPILDLFYYNGYAHPVKGIPNFTSRIWFNFVQCDPKFKNISDKPFYPYIDDITERLRIGVTVFHEHNGAYDLDQEKENYESWLFE